MTKKQIIKFKGNFKYKVKSTSQGVLGVAEDFPIVVEASDTTSLETSLIKAISVYILNYTHEAQKLLQVAQISA